MPNVVVASSASSFIATLPAKQRKQIGRAITELKTVPFPHNGGKVLGTSLHKKDCGEYRIIYEFHGGPDLIVYIVGRRNDLDVYRRALRL